MDYVTRHEGYEYASMAMATAFLVPQVFKCYYSQSAGDLSAMTLGMILSSSLLWAVFCHDNDLEYYTTPTVFVSANALCLLGMKVWYARPHHRPVRQADAPKRRGSGRRSRKEAEAEAEDEDDVEAGGARATDSEGGDEEEGEAAQTDMNKLFCKAGLGLASMAAMAV